METIVYVALFAGSIGLVLKGLDVLHRQRLSGGTRGRALAWSISALCFALSAAIGLFAIDSLRVHLKVQDVIRSIQ